MEFFFARLILSSFSRKQAPSTKISPHVQRQIMSSLRSQTSLALCSVELRTSVLPARRLYPLEKMTLEGEPYHKTCFKCAHGGCLLTNASYASLNGILYCQHHFWQLFKETGSYNNLLKPASAKNTDEPEASKEEQAPEVVEDQEHS